MATPFRTYNLEATFETSSQAQRAADDLSDLDVAVTIGTADERASVRSEMRDELEGAVAGPGNVGPFTKAMTRGILKWVPIGTLLGAVAGFLVGLLPWGYGRVVTLVVTTVAGAVAGATAGFVAGGATRPRTEHEGEVLASERGVVLGVHTDAAALMERAERALARHGPARIGRVDRDGRPLRASSPGVTRPVRGEVPTGDGQDHRTG